MAPLVAAAPLLPLLLLPLLPLSLLLLPPLLLLSLLNAGSETCAQGSDSRKEGRQNETRVA